MVPGTLSLWLDSESAESFELMEEPKINFYYHVQLTVVKSGLGPFFNCFGPPKG